MNLTDSLNLAEKTIPEFNSPEVITHEGLVKVYSDFAICVKESNSYNVYADGVLIGESELSPLGAWQDAAMNLPQQFLDSFELYFSETGIYYTKENDRHDADQKTFGRPSGEKASYSPSVVLGVGYRDIQFDS